MMKALNKQKCILFAVFACLCLLAAGLSEHWTSTNVNNHSYLGLEGKDNQINYINALWIFPKHSITSLNQSTPSQKFMIVIYLIDLYRFPDSKLWLQPDDVLCSLQRTGSNLDSNDSRNRSLFSSENYFGNFSI